MDTSSVRDWLNSCISLKSHKVFENCVKVKDVQISALSDQLLVIVSDINRLKMVLEYSNGEIKEIKCIFKVEPSNSGFNQLAKDMGLCDAETMVYEKVLKKMEELFRSKDKSEELLWPECYLCHDKKFILQDLCVEGYRVVPTYEQLDVKHATFAMEAIGKYHAMGLVLKDRGVINPATLPTNFWVRHLPFINDLYVAGIGRLAGYIETEWSEEWKPVGDKLRKFVENVDNKLEKLVTSMYGKCSVLCHGDYTIRNLLFKYDNDNSTPVKIKVIDFQGANWSNLAMDIVNFLCSSTFPQTRDQHLDHFLKVYWTALSETCKRYGYSGYIPTQDDVRNSYNSLGYVVCLGTLFFLPIFVGARDDFKMDSYVENEEATEDAADKTFKISYFKSKPVHDALVYQLEQSLKQNVL